MLKPQPLTKKDWKLVFDSKRVKEYWQLDETDTIESFMDNNLGAKFVLPKEENAIVTATFLISSGRDDGPSMIIHKTKLNFIT
jgi:hypothetical protein